MEMDDVVKILLEWQPEVVIADEAHRLKNPEGKRARKAIAIGDVAKVRYALTGSPILNSAMDIFNIFRFLDKGSTFGANFWKFRAIWFEDENAKWNQRPGYFPKWIPRPETYAEFNKLIYKKAIRAVKSECLDLPPFVRKEVFVEMSPEQKRMYEEMKADYIAYIDDILKTDVPRAVVAQMAVTKALRLMQIVTGYAKDEDGNIYKIKDNPRISALSELLEELAPNHKIIVWSVFHENYSDIEDVCRKLGIDYTQLHGKVAQKDRDTNIDRFNNDRNCRVLIANQAAGGIGINLVPSDIAIFYSKNFSLEQDIQAEGRNYRGGSEQHTRVTRIDIVAPDTIDDLINKTLAGKQEVATKILDWR
jgi:SNF2 family DNA or RNA helicase